VSPRLLACALLLACAPLAGCSDYGRARRAYEAGDYAEAVERFGALAQAGDIRAQYDLAQMHFQGIGTKPDAEAGWTWLQRSARGGNTAAMVELGRRHETGVGAERNAVLARNWYVRASVLGDPVARFHLGLMHLRGVGVVRDPVAAYAYFSLSSRVGSAAAAERVRELDRTLGADEVSRARDLADSIDREWRADVRR
jgi:TPR repeat protein